MTQLIKHNLQKLRSGYILIETEDDCGVIDGDVEVLPSLFVDELHTVDVKQNVLSSNDEDIVNENAHEAIGNEGVHPGNDIEQAETVCARRSSRVPNTRFRLQTTDEDYEFSTVGEEF